MPSIIVAAVIAIGAGAYIASYAAIVGIGLATAAVISSIGAGLVFTATSYLLGPKPKAPNYPGLGAGGISSLRRDIRTTVRSAISPAHWILGRARIGGLLVFLGVEDEQDDEDLRTVGGSYLHMAMALSEGPIETVEKIWIGEEEHTVGSINPDGAAFISGPKSDNAAFWFYLDGSGVDTGVVLHSKFPDEWTDSHKGKGIAWVHVRLHQPSYKNIDDRVWAQIPQINFLVKGLKFTWPGVTTPTWTENAAAVWYWWIKNRRGIASAGIDETAFTSALATCGETIEGDEIRYSANGVISSEDDPESVEYELQFAMVGIHVEWNGVYYLRAGSDRPISANITHDEIISVDEMRPAASRNDRVNQVSCGLVQSLKHDYSEWRVQPVNDLFQQRRDGEILSRDLGLKPFISRPNTLARLLAIALRIARLSAVWTITVRPGDSLEMMTIRPGDFINCTEHSTGLKNDLMYVIGRKLNPDWTLNFTLRKQDRGVYHESLDLSELNYRNLSYPALDTPPPGPTSLSVSHTVEARQDGGLQAVIMASVDPSPFETLWRLIGPENYGERLAGESVSFDVSQLGSYVIYVRHISSNNIVGPEISQVIEVLRSDIDSPEPVPIAAEQHGNTLQLVFQDLPERIIRALEVRATVGDVGSTNTLPIITESNWKTEGVRFDVSFFSPSIENQPMVANVTIPASGRYRLFCRLIDSWGNYSDVVEIGYRVLVVSAETVTAEGYWPLWPGELVNLYPWTRDNSNVLLLDRDTRDISKGDWNGAGGWPFGEASDNRIDPYYQPPDIEIESAGQVEFVISYETLSPPMP